MSIRPTHLLFAVTVLAIACDGSTGPADIVGTYRLVEENGQVLPSDPSAPDGCCLTLSGSLILTATTYDLRTSHRNKNNGIEFDNAEQGTWTRQGDVLAFTRTGGGDERFPYLLGPGTVTDDGDTVTLLYGDEGPGSDQTEAIFRRDGPVASRLAWSRQTAPCRGVSCIRFRPVAGRPLHVRGEVIGSMPADRWIEIAEAARRRR